MMKGMCTFEKQLNVEIYEVNFPIVLFFCPKMQSLKAIVMNRLEVSFQMHSMQTK